MKQVFLYKSLGNTFFNSMTFFQQYLFDNLVDKNKGNFCKVIFLGVEVVKDKILEYVSVARYDSKVRLRKQLKGLLKECKQEFKEKKILKANFDV
jgi:hypothetical protein